jgi:Ca2+-binding EF-hand superfamily protein
MSLSVCLYACLYVCLSICVSVCLSRRLGVPVPVVSAKVAAAGLDASVLDNPDAMISLSGGGGGGGAGSAGPQPVSRTIFNKYDPGGSGHISTGQFQSMALDFGVFLSGDALSIAVKMIDHDGNGTIEYDEFLAWYKQSSFSSLSLDDETLNRRSSAAKLFRKYDDDNSGTIDVEEFKGLYSELKMLKLTNHSCEKAMEDMDSDGDGKIEFNEFVGWIDRYRE